MKATCTWGDGPDVLLSLNGTKIILHESPTDIDKWKHGIVKEGSIDLTRDEARELAHQLLSSSYSAEMLEISVKTFDREIENEQT